jgi:hypothetical protein
VLPLRYALGAFALRGASWPDDAAPCHRFMGGRTHANFLHSHLLSLLRKVGRVFS